MEIDGRIYVLGVPEAAAQPTTCLKHLKLQKVGVRRQNMN